MFSSDHFAGDVAVVPVDGVLLRVLGIVEDSSSVAEEGRHDGLAVEARAGQIQLRALLCHVVGVFPQVRAVRAR